jgi:outer membrane protein assembly factor BamB
MSSDAQPERASVMRRYSVPIIVILAGTAAGLLNWTTDITSEVLMPKFGTSAQSVLGRVIVFTVVGALLVWLIMTGRVSRKAKAVWLTGALVLVGVAALSIREIENTGDNNYVIRYRWQPTQDQRLEEYQRSLPSELPHDTWDVTTARFTDFLGDSRNGVVPGPRLLIEPDQFSPREVWRRPVGGGYAGFVIASGLAVTIEQRQDAEVVVAMDLSSGVDRWTRSYPGHFKESMGGNGPRATPTISDNEVFALGADGLLVALDLASGQEKWRTNILQDAEAENLTWGMSGAPLVSGDKVIVNSGGTNGAALIAYHRDSGEIIWKAGQHKAGYSSPVLATIGDKEQVMIFDAAGVAGHCLQSGQELWRFPFSTFDGINVGQPLLLPDNQVFVSAGYNSGAALIQIQQMDDQWTAKSVWRNKRMKCKMSSAIYRDGYLYGLDDGILACLDALSGQRMWKAGRYGHGQMLLRDNILIVMAESGDVVFVETNPEEHRELARLPVLPGRKTWNAPALADELLLVRNHFEAVLLELPVETVTSTP